jgi:UDP-perosamine 4-acetyltransferase
MTGPVVLAGGGGHAKVVADILEGAGVEIAGCVGPRASSELPGLPWLGEDSDAPALRERGFSLVHVAIGHNALRRKLAGMYLACGFRLVPAVSHRAVVSPKATLGEGVAIMPGAVINAYAHIGDCAIVNTAASVDHDCRIGDYVHIAPGCHLAGNVVVGEGTFLGTGCSVIPEIRIGAWSVVGAGGVVVRSLPDAVTAVGVPARPIRNNR